MTGSRDVVVAVVAVTPVFRRGLATALAEAGFECEEPTDVEEWAQQPGRRAVVATTARDVERDALVAIPDLTVVALLPSSTPDAYAAAFRSGVDGASSWGAAPEAIVDVLVAALGGCSLLSIDVVRDLAHRGSPEQPAPTLEPDDVAWLRALARGTPITDLARKVGHSERSMYRLLGDLYRRLGASTRLEAIVRAARWGLLD